MREVVVGTLYIIAGASVTYGTHQLSAAVTWIVGGVVLALLTFMFFAETSG